MDAGQADERSKRFRGLKWCARRTSGYYCKLFPTEVSTLTLHKQWPRGKTKPNCTWKVSVPGGVLKFNYHIWDLPMKCKAWSYWTATVSGASTVYKVLVCSERQGTRRLFGLMWAETFPFLPSLLLVRKSPAELVGDCFNYSQLDGFARGGRLQETGQLFGWFRKLVLYFFNQWFLW